MTLDLHAVFTGGAVRGYWHEDELYLIRDIWSNEGRDLQVQYFHAGAWHDTREGVSFGHIRPALTDENRQA